MKAENYVNLVNELNGQIDSQIGNCYYEFNYNSDGFYDYILFGDICLYNSDNDGSFETEVELKSFVINEFNKYKKYIKAIKL